MVEGEGLTMITSAGAICDVCGKYILPLIPIEFVNTFSIAQIPFKELHCDNACKEAVLKCAGDWRKLPDGPLRKVYEEAAKSTFNGALL